MIASVKGRLTEKGDNHVVIYIGGIGLRIGVPAGIIKGYDLEENVLLYTHLVVRDDNISIYGFDVKEQLEIFQELLRVNGIGPRLALVIISTLSINQIINAVSSQQAYIFNQVPGIGNKTAQKIIFQLNDRIKNIMGIRSISDAKEINNDLMDALIALGYSVVESQAALQSLPKDAPELLEERIRLALQYFSS